MFEQREMREAHGVLALFLVALAAGGSAVHGALNVAFVQAAAAPLLIWLALTAVMTPRAVPAATLVPVLLLLAWLLLAAAQLLPLPPGLWRALPGRETMAAALAVEGVPDRWWPVSLFPVLTRNATLQLIAPIAIFVGALRLDDRDFRAGVRAAVLVAAASALLAAIQLLSGDGRWFLYPGGEAGVPSGLFSNRNHQAILMIVAIPLLFAAPPAGRAGGRPGLPAVLTALLALVLALSALLTRSRASLLILPAVILAIAMLRPPRRRREGDAGWPRLLAGGGVALAVALLIAIGDRTLMPRFGGGPDQRLSYIPDLLWAARTYFPVGSGIGSFVPVFASAESLAIVKPTFVNHAHDEYIQLLIEGGVPAMAIVAGFLAWLAARGWAILRTPIAGPADRLARAALIAMILLLVHSVVDYPLRTQTLAALFAFLAAGVARSTGMAPARIATAGPGPGSFGEGG